MTGFPKPDARGCDSHAERGAEDGIADYILQRTREMLEDAEHVEGLHPLAVALRDVEGECLRLLGERKTSTKPDKCGSSSD